MDASLAYLRNCWNNKISPVDAIKDLKDRNDIDAVKFFTQICVICSDENVPMYYIDFCIEIIISFYSKLFLVIDTNNYKQIQGLQNAFSTRGSDICTAIPVGSKESALWALKMLEICIIGDNIQKEESALTSLLRAPVFSVLIASGRLYCYPDFTRVRNLFDQFQIKNKDVINQFQIKNTHGYSNLETALFADKITKTREVFDLLNVRSIIGASFFFWVPENRLFTMVGTYNTRITYLYIVQGYLNVQSMTTAYIITNFFFRTLPSVAGSHITVDDINPTSFNGKVVSEVLARITPEILEAVNFPLSSSQLIEFICSLPSNLSDSDYPEIIYSYPALVSNLIPHFIELAYDPNSLDNFFLLAKNLTEVIEDFRCLVCKQDLIYETLDALMHVIRFSLTQDFFSLLFCMYIYIIRFSWRSGSKSLRDHLHNYAMKQDKDLSLFLRIMLDSAGADDIHEKITISNVNDSYSIYEKSFAFFKMLFTLPDEEFPNAVKMVNDNPYLWPFLLIYAKSVNCPHLSDILKYKFPDVPILNYLFSAYMMNYDSERCKGIPILSDDFDYLLKNSYEIYDLNFSIFQHIAYLSQTSMISLETIYRIIVSWRAWVFRFGIVDFTMILLENMNFEMKKISDSKVIIETYEAIAYLIVCTAENDDESLMKLIDQIIKAVFDSTNEKIEGSYGLSHFCIVVLLGMTKHMDKCFIEIMRVCSATLNERWDTISPPMLFAITLIKLALYIPLFQNRIPPDLFSVLMRKNDWKTSIDFFIATGLSNRSGSPESPDIILYNN